jgi:tetratricopeptide (TPR) repeat protein
MKRILLMALLIVSLVVCLTSLGWAGGLDDADAGRAAAQGGNYDEAIRLFTKAIDSGELSQEHLSVAYNNRGNAWYKKGDYDRAVADYTKVIEIEPRQVFAYTCRGNAWYKKGDYDKAIADFTTFIEIEPRQPFAYNNRGNAWGKKGDYEKAIADFTKAIEVDPQHTSAYNSLAWLFATCPDDRYRDGTQAVELAEKAVELDEAISRLDTLAAAYAEAGRFQDAIQTQEQAIAKLKQAGGTKYLAEFEQHLESYKDGKPWREQ